MGDMRQPSPAPGEPGYTGPAQARPDPPPAPPPRTVPTTAAHEAFYREALTAVADVCRRHDNIRVIEVLACLGRAAGGALAACHGHERDDARRVLDANIDGALADHAIGRVTQALQGRK